MGTEREIQAIGSLSFGNEPAKTKFIAFRGFGGGEGKPLIHADLKNNFSSYSLCVHRGILLL